jgi:7-cyano-7-deazaguanine synthase
VESEGIPTTYVPFRNANLLSMATSYAEAHEASAIFIGAHSKDFAGYPDCRPAFFEAFQQVIEVGTNPGTEISLEAPLVEWSKTEIAERGLKLGEHERADHRHRREGGRPRHGTGPGPGGRLSAFGPPSFPVDMAGVRTVGAPRRDSHFSKFESERPSDESRPREGP